MKKIPKILTSAFKKYQERAHRGIYIDTHMEFVKLAPAEYTGSYTNSEYGQIDKRDVYDAIVAAAQEAKDKGLASSNLPVGLHTHHIELIPAVGHQISLEIAVILDINGAESLDAFQALSKKYNGCKRFQLGRLPYHSDTVHTALKEAITEMKHCRIGSVFARKRDNTPRVYVTMAFNDHVFNIKSSAVVSLDFDDSETADTGTAPGQSFDVDL